jgi:D-amino-acid N-acetyltransferase
MAIEIRPVRASDEPAWRGLWEQYNQFYKRTVPDKVTHTTFTRFLDDTVRIYGAVAVDASQPEKLIGFVHWYPHPSTSSIGEVVYLHDLFVDAEIRNKGTGRQLIEHVYEHAKGLGADSVYWHTQYFNHRAQLLYTKVAERTDFVQYFKQL